MQRAAENALLTILDGLGALCPSVIVLGAGPAVPLAHGWAGRSRGPVRSRPKRIIDAMTAYAISEVEMLDESQGERYR